MAHDVMGLAALAVALVAPSLARALGLGGTYAAGAALHLVGTGVLATGADSVALTVVALAVIGAGLPACFVPLFGIGTSHVKVAESGVGSGLLNTFNETGAALGIAVIGTVLAASVDSRLDDGGSVADATAAGVGNGFLALTVCSGIALVVALVLRSPTCAPEGADA
ncbi:hypothetical protein ABZY81_25860 [Streptomyces sp. NPDC006514]|uniref:hypothetical protein n=1 Tax=Streptomyces sp. NPDC006514 TaxID=3154308 RepID=UPI0033B60674